MNKQISVSFKPDWSMTLTLNIPSDWDIEEEKAMDYYYEQLNNLSKEELINQFLYALEGGFDITYVEEI